jgi:hypothetical protein
MARGAASTKSATDTPAATRLHSGRACGALDRKSTRLPHSSDSTCKKADPAQRGQRHHLLDLCAHQFEQPTRTGVEQQRLVVEHQVLVEAEVAGDPARRRGDVDAVDVARDLVDVGARRSR